MSTDTTVSPLRLRMIEMLWGRGGEGVAPSARCTIWRPRSITRGIPVASSARQIT